MRVQIPLILNNYKRVTECQPGNLFQNIYSLAFSFETSLIKKHIQRYQTVTAINTFRVLPINSNLHAFLKN